MDKRSLPAVLDSLAELRRFAREAAAAAGVDEAKGYQLQLAVDEIATNIINYGFGETGASSVVTISSEVRDGRLIVTLEDTAPAFDPRSNALPEAEELELPLEEREIGGLGIFLAVSGVDHFDYRREGDRNLNIFEVGIEA